MIADLTLEHGVEVRADHKRVWAVLAKSDPPAPPTAPDPGRQHRRDPADRYVELFAALPTPHVAVTLDMVVDDASDAHLDLFGLRAPAATQTGTRILPHRCGRLTVTTGATDHRGSGVGPAPLRRPVRGADSAHRARLLRLVRTA